MTAMMNFRTASKAAQRNKQEIVIYAAFAAIALIAGHCLTQFALSACLSLSSGIQCLGFSLLMPQAYNGRDVSNVSLNSLALYVIALGFRLFATLQYNGYQPLDASGKNGLYHACEVVEMLLAAGAYVLVKRAQDRQDCRADETPKVMLVLLAACAVLAPLTHSHLNADKLGDITWIMGLYVETIAMIPQLYLLQKTGGEVEALHGHYIASTFASRVVTMYFWYDCYVELQHPDAEYNLPGSMVIGAQALQCLVFADFMYLYAKSVRYNKKLIIEM